MKRPHQHVMEDLSGNLFERLLPAEWIVPPIMKDYGVDYEVELVDQEVVLGDRIWVQLKSAEATSKVTARWSTSDLLPDDDRTTMAEYIPYSMKMKETAYARRCHFPLLLVLVDLKAEDAYWLPIRDEVDLHHSGANQWPGDQESVTLRMPPWNSLTQEKTRNYAGLRWYAAEPGRMYALARLHHFFHEFQNQGRLSDYSIGDGHIEGGEEQELKRSLELARGYCEESLKLNILFGEQGVDFFRMEHAPGIKWQLVCGAESATKALNAVESDDYTFETMSILLGRVGQAIAMMSTANSAYQGFKGRFLLTKEAVQWGAREAYTA